MKTVFAAAAGLTATTFLTGTVAAAAPMVPLAPADCQSYQFSGLGQIIEDGGPTLFTGWGPDGRSGAVNTRDGFTVSNRPDLSVPAGTPMNGTIRGGIDGRHVQFTVTWDDAGGLTGTIDTFYGQVYSVTDVRGELARANNQFVSDKWHWQGEVKCTDPTSAAANKPPTQATVDVATDIYDKPDGTGKKIGTLYPGEVHPVMEPCHDDWCRVGQIELGGYEGLPNGTAWVYTKGFITLS
ncbi:MAG TPA: hypothetical protein VHT50_03365 [Mycobacterium sp.]|nr:hypothetical protein [Mycobacterium sp.]